MAALLAGIPQFRRPAALIASCCALVLLATVLLLPRAPPAPGQLATARDGAPVRLDSTGDRRSGNELLWQLPPTLPRAALFAAPGCTIRATDFFDASPGCPSCAGLPEERRFTSEALRRGYAVLAVSSRAESWSLDTEEGSELAAVESIIEWWVREKHPHQLAGLPLVGIGASSGGYFLSALAARVRFSSVAIMIAEGVFGAMEDIPANYPPALFVHMPKDDERAREVASNMGKLKGNRVSAGEIQCGELAVSAQFLAARIPGLTRAVADGLVDVLHRKGFVDEKGFLKKDGRSTPWKKAAEEAKVLPEGFRLERHVTEELNVAYAYHEFTSLKNGEIFEWFESHMDHKS
uniref:Peptidase S9 prolyl oligopeptidase catalytic domain-containing protein n=1 Tax=Oryza brachyantha TaxID=4533 RepID=J3LB44_ORYBR